MIPWKDRLYAFLLSRVLGPWLDDESLKLLHESIEVSLQEGKLILKHISLKTHYLTKKLDKSDWRICRATVGRLDVSLSLEEVRNATDDTNDSNIDETTESNITFTSFAWRAMALGSTVSGGGKIALMARVVLDEVEIHVEPDSSGNSTSQDKEETQGENKIDNDEAGKNLLPSSDDSGDETPAAGSTFTTTAKHLLSSYLEAALAALRLSVEIHQLTVRLLPQQRHEPSPGSSEPQRISLRIEEQTPSSVNPWVEVRVKSISYQDAEKPSSFMPHQTTTHNTTGKGRSNSLSKLTSSKASYSTVMHKALDLTRLSLVVGKSSIGEASADDPSLSTSTTLVLLEGITQLRMRVIEYKDLNYNDNKFRTPDKPVSVEPPPTLQQDVEIFFGQKLSLFVDQESLQQLTRIASDLKGISCPTQRREMESTEVAEQICDIPSSTKTCDSSRQPRFSTETVDQKAIEGIMAQYNEARRRAERNEVRGGLLLPDISTINEGEPITFDAFFDANDQSFYRYSTMLSKSQALASANEGIATKDVIHTKVRCHLNSASAKVSFQEQRDDEYLLATISDVEVSSSLSSSQSTLSLSVSHFEIEYGQVDRDSRQTALIRSVLAFTSTDEDTSFRTNQQHDRDDDVILVQAPCIAVTAVSSLVNDETAERIDNKIKATAMNAKVDVDIEPFVLICPRSLTQSISRLISKSFPCEGERACSPVPSQVEKEINPRPRLSLNTSCAHFDVIFPLDKVSHDDWVALFARPGVWVVDQFLVPQSALGVRVERMFIQTNSSTSCRSNEKQEVTFQHILSYAYLHSNADEKHRLLDLIALTSGQKQGYFKLTTTNQNYHTSATESQAVKSFPMAPAISSFKARQEDDDDDESMLSPSQQLRMASRRELRGRDPQPQMLQACARANTCFELNAPRLAMDLSVHEIAVLAKVIRSQTSNAQQRPTEQSSVAPSSERVISWSIGLDNVSIGLHEDTRCSLSPINSTPMFSYLLKLSQVRSNVFTECGIAQHVRFLVHDASLIEVEDLLPIHPKAFCQSLDTEERVDLVRRRISIRSRTKICPILYRSHIFTPISRQSPVMLLDITGLPGSVDITQSSIYLTMYDITYRFQYDSQWLHRVKSLAMSLSDAMQHEREEIKTSTSTSAVHNGSMTKLFFCMADCNIDYSSPCRWTTPARVILRFGEVRVSSNMIRPSPALQAIKLSVGDFSCSLCNSRFPYSFENSMLLDTEGIRLMDDTPLSNNTTAAEVLSKMNVKNMMILDCLDAVLNLNNSNPREPSHPRLHAGLTIGQISLFACKDSFTVLMNVIGEFCAEACAMDEETFQGLKKPNEDEETYYDSMPHEEILPSPLNETLPRIEVFEDLKQKSFSTAGTASVDRNESSFLLDGYDWTTINQDECVAFGIPPGDEQAARWYGEEQNCRVQQNGSSEATGFRLNTDVQVASPQKQPGTTFRLISHHFPLQPSADPLADGDMGASKYAGQESIGQESIPPQVKTRVTVSDLSFKLRLFDGYDWPESLQPEVRTATRTGTFLIELDEKATKGGSTEGFPSERGEKQSDRKASLMAGLLSDHTQAGTFDHIPLPEERGARLKAHAELRRLARRMDKCVQFSGSGVQFRLDAFEQSDKHRLSSCLDIKAQDFFLAETLSSNKPIKMVGEWFNDTDHPRDSSDGLFSMKMVTWYAATRVSPEGGVMGDECEVAMKVLPLRCFLDQKTIRFLSAYFKSDTSEETKEGNSLPAGLHSIPPPLFRKFIAKPIKLKVNYKPQKLDQSALYNGQIVELLNLSPLDSLVLTLQQVEVSNVVGFGGVVGVLVPKWIQYVSSTQLLKFLTNAKPFQPITTVGEGFSDMVVLPWEAVKQGGDFQKALRAGAASFGRAVAYQALTLSSEAAEVFASVGGGQHLLPSRPVEIPVGVKDTTSHVVESLSRGFQAANTKIVIIPYHEYQRNGTTGLVTSVIRGIPVAITAPASGAAEAISYALIGMRNRLRPDIRREEEASQRGLRFGG
ncbi:hypothetical protein ACA910_010791 [Epithemia clementina (nom. ined.)]